MASPLAKVRLHLDDDCPGIKLCQCKHRDTHEFLQIGYHKDQIRFGKDAQHLVKGRTSARKILFQMCHP
jgi:hypothetical protein